MVFSSCVWYPLKEKKYSGAVRLIKECISISFFILHNPVLRLFEISELHSYRMLNIIENCRPYPDSPQQMTSYCEILVFLLPQCQLVP